VVPKIAKNTEMDLKSYEAHDKLQDGRVLNIRSIRPDDKPILIQGLHNLSPQSRYFRFFTHKDEFSQEELAYFTELDFSTHVGLLASLAEGDSERPVAIGRYIVSSDIDKSQAELAFVVKDEYRGLGIATILLKHLIDIARAQGIGSFIALVLPDNTKMLHVFRKSGLPMQQVVNSVGVLEISMLLK
jgi:GNAT superfamily N-acetyltransferase